jgi:hypothetical protein
LGIFNTFYEAVNLKTLKGSLIVADTAVLGNAVRVQAATMFPKGLIYTQEAPGRRTGKKGAHMPRVTLEGRKVTVVTPHPMTKGHYIVKHTLITNQGEPIGEKFFLQVRSKPAIIISKMGITLSARSLMKREYTRFEGRELMKILWNNLLGNRCLRRNFIIKEDV